MGSVIDLPKQGLAGEYRIVARKANGSGERLLADWFDNLITDVGLDNLINNNWKAYCHVGTGTATPQDFDTALQTPVASTGAISNSATSNSGAPDYYSQASIDYQFPVGAGTFTEVGVANAAHTGSYVLFSRALIVDGSGNPTAITTLADEYLVVTYRMRIYPNLTDTLGTIGVGSDVHNYTIRASRVNNTSYWVGALENAGTTFIFSNVSTGHLYTRVYSGGLGSITSTPGGILHSVEAGSTAYVAGSRQALADALFGFGAANGAGFIGSLAFWPDISSTLSSKKPWGSYQIGFDPPITKDAGIQLTFTVGMGWGRYVAP